MAEPTGSDLHVDTLLSNLSIAYMNEPSSYIADTVFPVVYSNKQSDLYAKYNKYDWFRDEAKQRAPLTEGQGGGFAMLDPGNFFCREYEFHKDYADEDVDNQDEVFDLDDDSTQFVVEKLRLSRENRWANAYFGEGIWGTDLQGVTTGAGANQFLSWDVADSTPISDIEDAKILIRAQTGLVGNTLIVSERVHMALKNHADIIDRFKYTQTGILTESLLAEVFEVDKYVVGKAVVAAMPEGSESMSYLLNQYGALLLYVAPRPSKRRPSAGYIFRWRRPRWNGKTGERLESTIRKFHIDTIQGTRVQGSVFEDIQQVASDCGVFFADAISAGRTILS